MTNSEPDAPNPNDYPELNAPLVKAAIAVICSLPPGALAFPDAGRFDAVMKALDIDAD